MAQAYKCDVSGKLCEGAGVQKLNVQITPGALLEVIPHNRINDKQYGQGTISPEIAGRIEQALKREFAPAGK